MKGNTIAKERYLELTALLIDREIAKFRRGEQLALVSFTNVAKLARNACNELVAPGTSARMQPHGACPRTERGGHSMQARGG
jgi:hypothetical protein